MNWQSPSNSFSADKTTQKLLLTVAGRGSVSYEWTVFSSSVFFFFPLIWSNKCKTNIYAIGYLFVGGSVSGYWLTSEPFFSCRSRAWLYGGWLKHSSSTPIPLPFILSCLTKDRCHLFSPMNKNLFCCFFCLLGFSLENIPVMEVVCFWVHFIPGGCLCVSGILSCPRQPNGVCLIHSPSGLNYSSGSSSSLPFVLWKAAV